MLARVVSWLKKDINVKHLLVLLAENRLVVSQLLAIKQNERKLLKQLDTTQNRLRSVNVAV